MIVSFRHCSYCVVLTRVEFDEGAMKDKTIEAAREMIDMLATQDVTHPQVDPKEHPLQYMFQSAWHRFKAVSGTFPHSPHRADANQRYTEKSIAW